MTSEDKVEKALTYLIESSEQYAEASSQAKYYYQYLKEVTADLLREAESTAYMQAEGSQEARKHAARTSDDYKEIVKMRREALEEYRQWEYKRQRLESGRESARILISYHQSVMRDRGGMI